MKPNKITERSEAMKKTIKIVLPILLIFALLVAGYWFFFQYRIDVTTGLLRDAADSLFAHEHYSLAIRCYRWANSLDPKDADLAMQLAEAYRQSGNYTKTENVLVHAIYDIPEDSRLYVKLSQVYVEQDKLLDAQQMLDTIANEAVRTELAQRRPAAPEFSPEGGYYSEYITVTVSEPTPEAVCYCTADGRYPSTQTDASAGTLTLPGGETVLRAVAVSPEGLASPLAVQSYTVAGVVEDVEFHDEALRTATQELLHRGNRTLRTDELWGIEELTLPEGLHDTQDLRHYTGLTELKARGLGDLDYSFLAYMPELRYLDLEGCALTTEALEQIGACPKLEVLILADCGISNVTPLGALQSLRILDLTNNSVNTITPISNLAALDELYLGHNALTILPVLRGFKSLRVLDLSYNALDYVGALSSCPTLERLNLAHNRLTSVKSVGDLKKLVWFNGSNNLVTDVSPLKNCTLLEGFLMTDNKLTDIDFLSACPAIREVNIDYNDVEAVPAFREDCPLETFSAAHNFLEDLSGLAGLEHLTIVNADYNNIRDISVLKSCPALAQVNVYGTYVHSGGVLEDKGVVVNYTPAF